MNINKTYYTIFRPHSNTHINISNGLRINHEAIKSSDEATKVGSATFLGVYIDNHLTFSQHTDQLCMSLSKSIFAINRVKCVLPYAALMSLYFFLIHSRLQYAIEALNEQFNSVYTEEGSIPMPNLGESPYGEIDRLQISISGVLDQLNKLNPSKAQGPDGIPPWFLNTYAAQLTPIRHNIFQLSVDSSQVPEDWKMPM